MDDSPTTNNRPFDNGTQSAWIASTPELLTETMTTPEHIHSAGGLNPSPSNQDSASLAFAQQFSNPANLPDLMPIMFPSDDPFAYPMQPMSTLEDDHFRFDRGGVGAAQHLFDAGLQQTGMSNTPSDPSSRGVSTPTFEGFTNLSTFTGGTTSSAIKSSLPGHLQTAPQSRSSSHLQSSMTQDPVSRGETISSPDLVSIPNQNFIWQGYNFQPTEMATDPTPSSQQDPSAAEMHEANMGVQENALGLNFDLGISFDDLFGNNSACRPGNGASADDWTRWMNVGG